MRVPNPGDPIRDFINRQLVIDINKKNGATQGNSPKPTVPDYNIVYGRLHETATTEEIKPYEPAIFVGPNPIDIDEVDAFHLGTRVAQVFHYQEAGSTALDDPLPLDDDYPFYTNLFFNIWGVALDYITKGNAGRILMNGVTWLDTGPIAVPNPTATHIHIYDKGMYQGNAGRAVVLNQITRPHTLVYLGDTPPVKIGRALEDIIPGGFYRVVLYKAQEDLPPVEGQEEVVVFTVVSTIPENSIVEITPVENALFAKRLC